MQLRTIHMDDVIGALWRNHTKLSKVTKVSDVLIANGRQALWASDDKWTVLVCGDRVGVAKRATYARMSDPPRPDVGLAIAASRLVNGEER